MADFNTMPLASIGVPVYNGERYLREALDSLAAQSYGNLEIILSDNASTDGTEAICREFAARDSRFSYHRAEENQGAIWNFNRAFELSRGEYFMWAAFDDLRHPSYVSRCVQVLEARPDAVQCSSLVRFVGEGGEETFLPPRARQLKATGPTRRRRVRALSRSNVWYDFYGLARSSALRQTRGPRPGWGFDVVLMMELYLRGPLLVIPEELFSYRYFEDKTQEEMAQTLGPKAGTDYSEMALNLAGAIFAAPLPTREKAALSVQFLIEFCVLNPFNSYYVRRDLAGGIERAREHRNARRLIALALLAPLTLPSRARRAADSARGRLALGTRLRRLLGKPSVP